MDEFHKWTPSIPVIMYHGNQAQREDIFQTKMMKNLKGGRPTMQFPVVCTSYEMVLRDQHNLSRIQWEFIIIVRPTPMLIHMETVANNGVIGRGASHEEC